MPAVLGCAVVQDDSWDLTRCFEERVLLTLPLVLLFICSAFRAWSLSCEPVKNRTSRSLKILWYKEFFLGAVIISSITSAIVTAVVQRRVPLTGMIEVVALAPAPLFTRLNHLRTRRSSSILLLFWPAYTLINVAWTRTVVSGGLANDDRVALGLRWTLLGAGLVSFTFEYMGPESWSELSVENGRAENPVVIANIFQQWDFAWLTPMMAKGAKDYLDEDDIPVLPPWDRSRQLGASLIHAREKHQKLWRALVAAYGVPYAFAAVLKIVQDALSFLQPQLLRWLLLYISDYQRARSDGTELPSTIQGFSIVTIMFFASLVQTFVLHQYFQRCFETGMRVRVGLIVVIYEKALRLSNSERSRSTGDIVNLQSVDATKLQDLCTYALMAISGPIQITFAFVSLYELLGWPAFVGVGIMVLAVPLNTLVANYLKRLQEQQMRNRDERTRLMSELLANIHSIKLFAWENAFMRRILSVRNDKELRMLRKYGIATAFNTTLWTGIPLLVAFSSFTVTALTSSKPLTSDVIFPAISLFNLLSFPLAMFATVIGNLIESLVSVRRISDMLEAEELQFDARVIANDQKPLAFGDEALMVKGGEFAWSRDARQPILEGIDMTLRKGELMGVWGPVGAGKTSLLSALCGEMLRLDGTVQVNGSLAYAPQNPWIMSATIKDNILFSHEHDEQFYNMVLDACALRPDLELLSDGDQTLVGEKGITLSGGQRARVGLARAVYARADIILLDDVLAALDSHVARHVMDHVIGHQGLLATKARVVVTHSIAHINRFDTVLYLRRGIILDAGSPDEVLAREQSELSKLVRGHSQDPNTSGRSTPRSTNASRSDDETTTAVESIDALSTSGSPTSTIPPKGRRESFGKAKLLDALPVKQPAEFTKEHREQGRVKWQVYMTYARASSGVAFLIFVIMCILQQALVLMSNLTLRTWGERNADDGNNRGALHYMLLYGLWILLSTIAGLVSTILIWVICGLKSARKLHDKMLHAVLRAPLSFFENTPTGRTLNLFSRDVYVVDQVLARVLQGMVRTLCVTLGIIVVVGFSFVYFLVALPPLLFFYVKTTQYYLATSRELKRLDAVSRSPIYSWFSESLAGLATIRAYRQQDVFARNNLKRIDTNSEAYLPSVSVNRWLSVRLELVGAVIILVSSSLALVALITSGVDAGLVGLVLSYALSTTSSLNWVVRSISELETNITSVERIIHQTELKSEAPAEKPDTEPHDVWPSQGAIEFKNYNMRYRPELDLVLRDITLRIERGQKVGICGRTGSGKSSLLLALFRVIEADSGSIYIDGVDSSSVGLKMLRSSISIVPQSPELFEGTLRFNIDPNEEHQDADIWSALDQAHLRQYVEGLEGKLDAPVSEGGASMSAGQRQLLCFARALLRKTKILILDEATSAVDLDTDRNIQEIIKAIPDVTLLCVAHRLNTIINYDKIIVLDSGQVLEYDAPTTLLENTNSAFYSLAREAGLAK